MGFFVELFAYDYKDKYFCNLLLKNGISCSFYIVFQK